MAFILDLEAIAIKLLEKHGINLNELFAERTGKLNKEQALKLKAIDPILFNNAMLTLRRLDKSDNKKGILFNRNLRNTVVGTAKAAIMENIQKAESKKNPTIVKIVPSSAEEQDAYHARFYGKTMTLAAALQIGITLRFGCQCGLYVLNNDKQIKESMII